MVDSSVVPRSAEEVPAPPPDSENPALIDAEKTFKITAISAVLFVLAAAFIILRTRMG
jgi:hypothetical protein